MGTGDDRRGIAPREVHRLPRESIVYDAPKFRELIVYIAQRSVEADIGDVKLNKILFFSDFYAYGFLGRPITGAEYQKQPMGPTARRLLPERRTLIEEGAIDVDEPRYLSPNRTTHPNREPNTALFRDEELALVDEVIEMFKGSGTAEVSEFSHASSAGWNVVEMRETIPYSTLFVSMTKPPRAAFDRGRELAAKFSW
jgi:hypothetical protein